MTRMFWLFTGMDGQGMKLDSRKHTVMRHGLSSPTRWRVFYGQPLRSYRAAGSGHHLSVKFIGEFPTIPEGNILIASLVLWQRSMSR